MPVHESDDPFNAGQAECQALLNDKFPGVGISLSWILRFFRLGFGQPRRLDTGRKSLYLPIFLPESISCKPRRFFKGDSLRLSVPPQGLLWSVWQFKPVDCLLMTIPRFALFPNPQTGEFYNGPATGCGADITTCGEERAASTDNPFAYTQIDVTAGGRVDNVNILMNTSEQEFLCDPGFQFCSIGDVNADNIVNDTKIYRGPQTKREI